MRKKGTRLEQKRRIITLAIPKCLTSDADYRGGISGIGLSNPCDLRASMFPFLGLRSTSHDYDSGRRNLARTSSSCTWKGIRGTIVSGHIKNCLYQAFKGFNNFTVEKLLPSYPKFLLSIERLFYAHYAMFI